MPLRDQPTHDHYRRERAYALYKEGFDTGTKIRKQLEAEGFEGGVSRGNVENWRRRDIMGWKGRRRGP